MKITLVSAGYIVLSNAMLFENEVANLKSSLSWNKNQIVEQFFKLILDFNYQDKCKYLDDKM